MRPRTVLPAVALGMLLAACGSSAGTSSSGQPAAGGGNSTSASTGSSGDVSALMTRSTSLGAVVTDSSGRVLYKFDKDTQGSKTSACKGACLTIWPSAHEASSMPKLTGITGKVGTITGQDGKAQLTLNGWPLYYFSGDSGPGAVTGQNYQGIWHVLTAAGTPVMAAASSGGGGGGGGGGYGAGY